MANYKDEDFIILGELIAIEIYPFSFTVTSQFKYNGIPATLKPIEQRFPIQFLGRFFKVNGEVDQQYYCHRPLIIDDNPQPFVK